MSEAINIGGKYYLATIGKYSCAIYTGRSLEGQDRLVDQKLMTGSSPYSTHKN
jgi:hypothetical protein